MDLDLYISSGILENYVLGTVSRQEKQEVECLSSIYPEIKDELTRLQSTMENFALANSVDPPAGLKDKILEAIESEEQEKPGKEEMDTMTVVHRDDTEVRTQPGIAPIWRTLAAASVILLAGALFLWVNSSNKLESVQKQVAEFESKQEMLQNELAELKAEKDQTKYINTVLADDNTAKVIMAGTDNSPESSVSVFWNKNSSEVFLKVASLPEPDPDKQYQLWAIVDGQPQDMGVFELDLASQDVQQMPYKVDNADAFAITLEPKGGSESPTLSAMYVLGSA